MASGQSLPLPLRGRERPHAGPESGTPVGSGGLLNPYRFLVASAGGTGRPASRGAPPPPSGHGVHRNGTGAPRGTGAPHRAGAPERADGPGHGTGTTERGTERTTGHRSGARHTGHGAHHGAPERGRAGHHGNGARHGARGTTERGTAHGARVHLEKWSAHARIPSRAAPRQGMAAAWWCDVHHTLKSWHRMPWHAMMGTSNGATHGKARAMDTSGYVYVTEDGTPVDSDDLAVMHAEHVEMMGDDTITLESFIADALRAGGLKPFAAWWQTDGPRWVFTHVGHADRGTMQEIVTPEWTHDLGDYCGTAVIVRNGTHAVVTDDVTGQVMFARAIRSADEAQGIVY
jgi:hypothetical protein